jgi:conjugal transfer pilus assembly protein TraE
MDANRLMHEIETRTGIKRGVVSLLALSTLANAALAGALVLHGHTVRTVVTPPLVEKEFWVDDSHMSPAYMEMMGDWAVQKFATVSPASVDVSNRHLLKLVHPSLYGELSRDFQLRAQKVKDQVASQVFWPREVLVDEAGQRVAFVGLMDLWVADKRVEAGAVRAFVVGFQYVGGTTTIKELREAADPAAPFATPVAAAHQ